MQKSSKEALYLLLKEQMRRDIKRDPRKALSRMLFKQQQEFFYDDAQTKIALCSRRAGKTYTCLVELVNAALTYPRSLATYLALTRSSAKEIMWAPLIDLCNKLGLEYTKHENDLTVTFSNLSTIRLLGADHKRVIETLRGSRRSIVVIDEFGSFSPLLQTLVDDAIEPSLVDLQGKIVFVGTPPPARTEYFEELIKHFKPYAWTLLDNPYIPHAAQWLEALKRKKLWSDDNPTYLREYCGIVVDDPDALVYKLKPHNIYTNLPENIAWEYIIGIDYGWHDANAIVVIAFSEDYPNAYVVDNWQASQIIPSTLAAKVKLLEAKYKPLAMVADTGGLGKSITEELRQRYELPIKPAEKTEKYANIELLNGDLIDKRLFIHESCTDLISQAKHLQWDDNRKEKAGMPNHSTDAMLYAYKCCRHYWHKDEPAKPKYGTEEWAAYEEQRVIEDLERQLTYGRDEY